MTGLFLEHGKEVNKVDRSYAHRIDRVKGILGGMVAYVDKLEKWGITQEFITNMTTLYNEASANEQQKNALKASTQQLTIAQDQLMEELESNCAMVKKLVRFELPKEIWPEFGFREGEYAEKSTASVG
jgi:hypothetical protein